MYLQRAGLYIQQNWFQTGIQICLHLVINSQICKIQSIPEDEIKFSPTFSSSNQKPFHLDYTGHGKKKPWKMFNGGENLSKLILSKAHILTHKAKYYLLT